MITYHRSATEIITRNRLTSVPPKMKAEGKDFVNLFPPQEERPLSAFNSGAARGSIARLSSIVDTELTPLTRTTVLPRSIVHHNMAKSWSRGARSSVFRSWPTSFLAWSSSHPIPSRRSIPTGDGLDAQSLHGRHNQAKDFGAVSRCLGQLRVNSSQQRRSGPPDWLP